MAIAQPSSSRPGALRRPTVTRAAALRSVSATALALLAAACPVPAASASVAADAAALTDSVAGGWATQQADNGAFINPSSAELAEGKGSFAPPMLMHGLIATGERSGQRVVSDAAARAWPIAVAPERASAFDMLGAGMTWRRTPHDPELRERVVEYLRRYTVASTGSHCVLNSACYHNLKLVDAVAVLVMTGNGLQSSYPGTRLHDAHASRIQAATVINDLVPRVVDRRMRARTRDQHLRANLLSDPRAGNPLAYHALSAYMLAEGVSELGAEASPGARRALDGALEALSVLMSPDGQIDYMGRGQAQVWVPAMAAAAAAHGAALYATSDPARAGRYVRVAQAALGRLRTHHLRSDGRLQVVPGERSTTLGVDWYAHTVAYNGLALYGINRATELLAPLAGLPVGAMPGEDRLAVSDPGASRLGVASRAGTWLAVRAGRIRKHDLRYDFGLLSLKVRQAGAWVDLMAPRPLTRQERIFVGPSLVRRGVPARPEGRSVRVAGDGTVQTRVNQVSLRGRTLRRQRYEVRAVAGGARITLRGARRGDRYRILFFTPAGTGSWNDKRVRAGGAVVRFSRLTGVRRLAGFHSGPVEHLDALEATVAPRRGRTISWTVRSS